MDAQKVGALIRTLRRKNNMTQRQLADAMNLSDKTISKWERAMGCPDVSLLPELSRVLDVSVRSILTGELEEREKDGGNMKRIKFYVCPACGNVITASAEAEISCCGRPLPALEMKPCDGAHALRIQPMDGETYAAFDHEMTKEHYIRFIACVAYDRMVLVRLYPEQGGEVRLPWMLRATYVLGCSRDGLFACQA